MQSGRPGSRRWRNLFVLKLECRPIGKIRPLDRLHVSYEGLPLASRPIADRPPERQVVLAWADSARLTRRATALVDFCRETFDHHP